MLEKATLDAARPSLPILVRDLMSRRILALALAAISQTGCMYSDLRLPYDIDVDQTQLGSKIGRADARSIMFLVSWGDASTAAAADNAQIKNIKHLDIEYKVILWGLYLRRTTIAYGD
jgi:TRL-like protein family